MITYKDAKIAELESKVLRMQEENERLIADSVEQTELLSGSFDVLKMLHREHSKRKAAEKFCKAALAMDSFKQHPDLLAWVEDSKIS